MEKDQTPVEILLVDKDHESARRLDLALGSDAPTCPYRTELAQSIPHAHARLNNKKFHLVMINDAIANETSLYQLIESICPDGNIPIIIVGDESDEQKAIEAVSFGAQDYLIKSETWDPAYLKRAIRHAIVRHDMKSKLALTQNRTQHLAYYDPLTQLPNRQLFFDRISQAVNQSKRNHSQFALLFIDLDNFKTINDRYGHNAGDEVLRIVAQRLSNGIRKSDTVARLGGDEFTVILNHVHDSKKTTSIVNELLNTLREPITYNQHELKTSASIGISVYPKDAQTVQDLIAYADQAMYSAKEFNSNSYQVFQPHIAARIEGRTLLKSSLKDAISKQELNLFYLPRVQLQESRITSLEGLCYWNHPKLGRLKPIDFIPLASEEDLIFEIDQWSLQQACFDLAKLIKKGIENVNISVNLSVDSFIQLNIDELILKFCPSSEVLTRLEIELPERILLEDCLTVSRKLDKLREIGVKLILDNFGSGLTNLNALKKLHFDFVKIDKGYDVDVKSSHHKENHIESSIDSRSESNSIFSAMINLTKAFNLIPIITGIENHSQIPKGKTPIVHYAQGFYFASPKPFNAIYPMLNQKLETLIA